MPIKSWKIAVAAAYMLLPAACMSPGNASNAGGASKRPADATIIVKGVT